MAVPSAAAIVIVACAPSDRAYDLCVGFARGWGRGLDMLLGRLGYAMRLDTATLPILQHILCVATRHGGITIRTRAEDDGLLEETFRRHGRVLLLTAHFGLTMAMQHVLRMRGIQLCAIGCPPRRDGLHWGCPDPLHVIEAGPFCLLEARRQLKAGNALMVYPDTIRWNHAKTPYWVIRPNIFDFAARIGVPVLFFDAVLASDGAIVVRVTRPSGGLPRVPAQADRLSQEFRAFLRARTPFTCHLEPARRSTSAEPPAFKI